MKKIILIHTILLLFNSCGVLSDAGKVMRNEKINTTDEFLVKKKNPLVLPPNYEELPEPGSIIEKVDSEQDNIKNILKSPKADKTINNKSSSTEKSILEKIRK